MSIKQYLIPETLESFDSHFNKDIHVTSFVGRIRLDMGGLTQSGEIIKQIWSSTIKKLIPKDFIPKNILLLGVGGGSVGSYLHRRWPESQIIGVEIDPEVIRIANQYFHAGDIPNFSIINDDAVEFVNRLTDQKFDLILVDCYQGDQIPKAMEDIKFLQKMKKHTHYLLLNRLFWNQYQPKTLEFISRIQKYFTISTCRTPSNIILSLSSRV